MPRPRPLPRTINTGSAGRGEGLFTVNVEPEGFSLQSGPVEEQGESAQMNESNNLPIQGDGLLSTNVGANMYVPDEDVTATLADGRTIQVATKGVPMPLAQAIAQGLVKSNQAQASVGPQETKETPAKGSAPSQAAKADNEK